MNTRYYHASMTRLCSDATTLDRYVGNEGERTIQTTRAKTPMQISCKSKEQNSAAPEKNTTSGKSLTAHDHGKKWRDNEKRRGEIMRKRRGEIMRKGRSDKSKRDVGTMFSPSNSNHKTRTGRMSSDLPRSETEQQGTIEI